MAERSVPITQELIAHSENDVGEVDLCLRHNAADSFCDIGSMDEVVEEDDLAEEDNWVEMPNDDDESEEEEDPPSIENLLVEVKKAISLWKERGRNINLRNFGTSRATFFRKEKKKKETAKAAASTHPLTNYFQPIIRPDSTYTDDEEEDNELEVTISKKFSTYDDALDELSKLELLSKDSRVEARRTSMLWEQLRQLAVTRYFCLMQHDDSSKRRAAATVATVVYGKSNPHSFKCRQIIHWADNYLLTGTFPAHKQGKHPKTASVVTDENVQALLKRYLRELKDEDRTPKLFRQHLNEVLLKTIPNAPDKVSEETARRWMLFLEFKPTKASKVCNCIVCCQ
jgi:hypothetical protein